MVERENCTGNQYNEGENDDDEWMGGSFWLHSIIIKAQDYDINLRRLKATLSSTENSEGMQAYPPQITTSFMQD